MTHRVLQVSAVAIGAAAFLSLSPLSPARADTPAASGMTSATSGAASAPSGAALAPAAPSSAPGGAASAASGATSPPIPPSRPTAAQWRPHTYARPYVHHQARLARHYRHPSIPTAAARVAGELADLGSLAAYPLYCFPHYGSCPAYLPY